MVKEIREWLESNEQPYAQGVALFETHGKSRVVLTALRRGESAFTRQKLRDVLQELVRQAPAVIDKLMPTPVAPKATAVPAIAKPAAAQVEVSDQVRAQRSGWYAERHRLHGSLELLPTDEERHVAAERIVELSALLTASYQGTEQLPAAASRPDLSGLTDQGEIRRRLANLRPQASKLKKNPARALDLQQARADIILLESKLLKP